MPNKYVIVVKRIIKVLKAPIVALKRKVQKHSGHLSHSKVALSPEINERQEESQMKQQREEVSQRIQFYEQLNKKPQVTERPLKQVSPTIQQLVTKIEVLKGIKREKPSKQVKPMIAALVQTIERLQAKKQPIFFQEHVENLALDEFFAWARVPVYALDEFFAWAEIEMLELDEFYKEETEDAEVEITESEELHKIRKCASFDALEFTNVRSFLAMSCPELPVLDR